MNKAQFCKRVRYFISDEKKAQKEYHAFPGKFPMYPKETGQVIKISFDEGRHKKVFQKIYKEYCGR